MAGTRQRERSKGAGTEEIETTLEVSTPVPPVPPLTGSRDSTPPTPAAARTWSKGFLIAGIVITVAAIVLLAIGIVGFASAGSATDDERVLAAERSELESTLEGLEQDQADLEEQTEDLRGNVSVIDAEVTALIDTGNRFVEASDRVTEVFNAAIDKGNAGDLSGERAMFENEGGQGLADMEAALITQQEALAAFQAAFVALAEALP